MNTHITCVPTDELLIRIMRAVQEMELNWQQGVTLRRHVEEGDRQLAEEKLKELTKG